MTMCECSKGKRVRPSKGCAACEAIDATRNIGAPEKVAARMPLLDEWVTAGEIANALDMESAIVSDAVGALADAGTLEKRRDRGSVMVYRLRRAA